ncbi:MAG: hypothetical protein R3B54_01405 [Bdellovibrionota bacterium]
MRYSIALALILSSTLFAADDFLIRVPSPEDIEFSVKRMKQTEHLLWTQTRLKEMRASGRFTESTEMMSLLVDKFKSGKAGTDSAEIAKQGNEYREYLRKQDKLSQSRSYYRLDEDPRYAMQYAWYSASRTGEEFTVHASRRGVRGSRHRQLSESFGSDGVPLRAGACAKRSFRQIYYADRAEGIVSEWKTICDENVVAAHADDLLFSGDGYTSVGTDLAQLAKRNGLLSDEVRNQFFFTNTEGKLYMDSDALEDTTPRRSATDDARSVITSSRNSLKRKPEPKTEAYAQNEALSRVERGEERVHH